MKQAEIDLRPNRFVNATYRNNIVPGLSLSGRSVAAETAQSGSSGLYQQSGWRSDHQVETRSVGSPYRDQYADEEDFVADETGIIERVTYPS
jgi:hypothetical protein